MTCASSAHIAPRPVQKKGRTGDGGPANLFCSLPVLPLQLVLRGAGTSQVPCPQFAAPSSLPPSSLSQFPPEFAVPSSPSQVPCPHFAAPTTSFRKRTKLLISDRADLRRSIEKKQPPCSMLMSQLKLPEKKTKLLISDRADLRRRKH